MVRIHPDPPQIPCPTAGAIAQLGERLLCKQEVTGSIPVGSTSFSNLAPSGSAFRFAVSFFRLLFNNLEEVKRIRFSQDRVRLGSDCIKPAFGDLSPRMLTKRSL